LHRDPRKAGRKTQGGTREIFWLTQLSGQVRSALKGLSGCREHAGFPLRLPQGEEYVASVDRRRGVKLQELEDLRIVVHSLFIGE